MKKLFIVLLFFCIIFTIGCSSSEERLEMAKSITENIIYQENENCSGCDDIIIGYDDDNIYFVRINTFGNIIKIIKIDIKERVSYDNSKEN